MLNEFELSCKSFHFLPLCRKLSVYHIIINASIVTDFISYHNYAATQLRRINENGRFSVPSNYRLTKSVAISHNFLVAKDKELVKFLANYQDAWAENRKHGTVVPPHFAKDKLDAKIKRAKTDKELREKIDEFEVAYDKAWSKLDDDLFNTARL